MGRLTIVDGYNLVKVMEPAAEPRADALERGRDALVRRLRGLPARPSERVIVVFDGRSGLGRGTSERWGAIEARFATGAGGADALILALVAAERDRSRIVVVTADRELAAQARALGARVTGSAAFAGSLAARHDPATGAAPPRGTTGRRSASRRSGRRDAEPAGEKPPPPTRGDLERWEEEFRRRDRDEGER